MSWKFLAFASLVMTLPGLPSRWPSDQLETAVLRDSYLYGSYWKVIRFHPADFYGTIRFCFLLFRVNDLVCHVEKVYCYAVVIDIDSIDLTTGRLSTLVPLRGRCEIKGRKMDRFFFFSFSFSLFSFFIFVPLADLRQDARHRGSSLFYLYNLSISEPQATNFCLAVGHSNKKRTRGQFFE